MTIRDNNYTCDECDRTKSVEFYSSPTPDFPDGKLLKKITYNYDWAGRLMERNPWKPRTGYLEPELIATTRYVYEIGGHST